MSDKTTADEIIGALGKQAIEMLDYQKRIATLERERAELVEALHKLRTGMRDVRDNLPLKDTHENHAWILALTEEARTLLARLGKGEQ